jgi:hypothetical protein
MHHFLSDEIYTPGGMPIRVEISLGAREELKVYSAATLLLKMNDVREYLSLELWLATDEVLQISLAAL